MRLPCEFHDPDGSPIAWGAPVWSGTGVQVDDDAAIVTVGRNAEAQVTLENHAATSTAGISPLKGIAGEAADEVDAETEFPVTATWTNSEGIEQSKDLLINSVQPTTLGEELPAGTVVTLTEGERPAISTVAWDSITITGTDVEDNGDGSATVTNSEQEDETTLITIVNQATWTPCTFTVTKEVTGVLVDHSGVPDMFTIVATWLAREHLTGQGIRGHKWLRYSV